MSKSESRRAVAIRSVRLTPEQDSAVVTAAEARGLGLSTFCREAILKAARQPLPKVARQRDVIAAELVPVLGSLGQIASLLNQLVSARNGTGFVDDSQALEQVRQALAELHRAVLTKASV